VPACDSRWRRASAVVAACSAGGSAAGTRLKKPRTAASCESCILSRDVLEGKALAALKAQVFCSQVATVAFTPSLRAAAGRTRSVWGMIAFLWHHINGAHLGLVLY
jgi:hypothetical protein